MQPCARNVIHVSGRDPRREEQMIIETGAQVRIAGVVGRNGEGVFLGVNENGLAVVELTNWGGVYTYGFESVIPR